MKRYTILLMGTLSLPAGAGTLDHFAMDLKELKGQHVILAQQNYGRSDALEYVKGKPGRLRLVWDRDETVVPDLTLTCRWYVDVDGYTIVGTGYRGNYCYGD